MKKINVRRSIYVIKHRYLNVNSFVILIAFFISANWVWGSLNMMERNYALSKELDKKNRELQIADLEVASLELEKKYLQAREYQELAAREGLGLVMPGEKVLILPTTDESQEQSSKTDTNNLLVPKTSSSNFDKWLDFLLGRNL